MADMLVKLWDLGPDHDLTARLAERGISIRRVLPPDRRRVVRFVDEHAAEHWPGESGDSWASECETALSRQPPTCFVAVRERQVIGFACYDATAKGFFGPTGVLRHWQGVGVGTALLLASLLAMWDDGYGYAIIGWPAPRAVGFYERTVGAQLIDGSSPGIYGRLVDAHTPVDTHTPVDAHTSVDAHTPPDARATPAPSTPTAGRRRTPSS